MDLKEAFYKQKDELHQSQRRVNQLEKELEKYRKTSAADKRVQELLSKIQGLNNKISEAAGISNRYKSLCDQKDKTISRQAEIIDNLEEQLRKVQWQNDCLTGKRSNAGNTAAEEAEAEIASLKDEVARLTAKLEVNSTNAGISTAKTAIDQKKRIPNSREKSTFKKGGQPGHVKHEMKSFNDTEISETQLHTLDSCPECGSHNLEEMSCSIKDEYDYEVVVKKYGTAF